MGQLEIFDPKTPQKWRNTNFSAGIRRKYGFLAPISPTTSKMVKLDGGTTVVAGGRVHHVVSLHLSFLVVFTFYFFLPESRKISLFSIFSSAFPLLPFGFLAAGEGCNTKLNKQLNKQKILF
jgi:hypothetical protein